MPEPEVMPMANPARRCLIVASAGHVDHGKTSLVSHITGVDTDTLAEEKARGLSINLGFAYYHFSRNTETGKQAHSIGFVDVPGHTDFINNMLAGVSAVEAALLVIAADDGIMPQTREHLAILDLLGIKQGLIAITKIDKVDAHQLATVTADVDNLLAGTSLHDVPIVPVSNANQQGIPEVIEHLQSLAQDDQAPSNPDPHSHFRYQIDRSFTVKGMGTVVTGTVRSGHVSIGSNLLHSATNETTKLRGLRLDQDEVTEAAKGQRVAANITIAYGQISRGDWLMDAAICHPVFRFDARLRLLEPHQIHSRADTEYHLFLGASHHVVQIRKLADDSQPWYQIASSQPVFAHYGDQFVLRDPASQHTIGGGHVVDIFVPRRRRASPQRLAQLAALDQDNLSALQTLLETETTGINLAEFAIGRNCTDANLDALLSQLAENSFLSLTVNNMAKPLLLRKQYYDQHCNSIKDSLARYHQSNSNQQGISEPALSKTVKFTGSHLLFHSLLKNLTETGAIKRSGTLLHLPEHKARLSAEESAFLEKVRPLLQEAGFVAPRTRELVEMTGIGLKPLDNILKQTAKAGNLIRVADNRYYLPETIMQLAEFTEQLAQQSELDEGFSVIQFRDTANTIGRNLCIEILEYFDKVGFTRRDGNSRFIRTDKENIFG